MLFRSREPAPDRAHGDGTVRDLSPREVMALAPLIALIVWIGVQPSFFLDRMSPTLDRILATTPSSNLNVAGTLRVPIDGDGTRSVPDTMQPGGRQPGGTSLNPGEGRGSSEGAAPQEIPRRNER